MSWRQWLGQWAGCVNLGIPPRAGTILPGVLAKGFQELAGDHAGSAVADISFVDGYDRHQFTRRAGEEGLKMRIAEFGMRNGTSRKGH